MQYEWREFTNGLGEKWRGLLPTNQPNNWSLDRIASIYRRPDGQYVAGYHYPHSTGNKQGNGAYHKTLRGSQRWVEFQLAKFWEPPHIVNPVVN